MSVPRQLTITLSVDMTVEADRRDWEIVMCYLDKKSLREVARELEISHETVSNALEKFRSRMRIAAILARTRRV